MPRHACPDLFPDPRPSRFFVPLLPHLPRLLRLAPWLAAAPVVIAAGALMLAALPILTWILVSVAVLGPIAAGMALFTLGWEGQAEG